MAGSHRTHCPGFIVALGLFASLLPLTASMSAPMAATAAATRSVGQLHPTRTCLLLCDMQERFRPLIHRCETVVRTCRYLTGVAQALEVPIVATQQYTKVFGPTLRDCFHDADAALRSIPVFEKKRFSMLTEEVEAHLRTLDRTSYLVVGIEAHVCVQQTCLDLLERGAQVHVVVDGVSSQRPLDRRVALRRLQQSGAYLTTAQSAAFMLLGSADHENFKTVSRLTVEHMQLENEFDDDALAL